MDTTVKIILLTAMAGAAIPLGGALATIENLHPRWLETEFRHFMIALGGGILMGSVAQVLIPEGIENLHHSMWSIPIFFAGGLCFFFLERWLGLQRKATPQLMGMLLDYIPEAIALGGLLALGSPAATLLAILIGCQNLPEGFNAYREMSQLNNHKRSKTLLTMLALVPLGPIAGLIGYFVLADLPAILGGIMLFASGGILYLIFQDIAPQSFLKRHWAPPLGAVMGFSIALFSDMLVG